ncbi:hypothetical protein GGR51DRAFT_47473 [Nemania sp. FL0031]|nr:hypothetical protein GGR51DRAFT_47473 [Nemania sp. FL0031]
MGEGAISGAIRFICHLPFGYYAFVGIGHFTFIRDHREVLLASPLTPKVFVGEVFSGPIGIISFFWNFFLWIPTIAASGGGLFLLGIGDAIITGFLIISLGIEATYIGFTQAQCAQLRPDAPPTSNLLFFQRVGEIEFKNKDSGEETCQAYYAKWYVGLVVALLYALSAITNLLIGSSSRSNTNSLSLRRLFKDIASVLAGCVDLLLPARVHNVLFFTSRYIRRWFDYKGSRTRQRLYNAYELISRRTRVLEGKEKGLHAILSPNILKRIVLDLHYADVVNLSLASKRTREAIFPEKKDISPDKEQLRFYTCWGNKKSDCWACGMQICDECGKTRRCPNSTASFHMSLCAAACSKCFYKNLSRGYARKSPCSCIDGRREAPAYSYGRAQHNSWDPRLVCGDCNNMKGDKILAERERRDRATYSNLSQQPLSCSLCSESLPRTGPRWWVCSKCKRECRNSCHVGWGQKLENRY